MNPLWLVTVLKHTMFNNSITLPCIGTVDTMSFSQQCSADSAENSEEYCWKQNIEFYAKEVLNSTLNLCQFVNSVSDTILCATEFSFSQ